MWCLFSGCDISVYVIISSFFLACLSELIKTQAEISNLSLTKHYSEKRASIFHFHLFSFGVIGLKYDLDLEAH